MLVAPVTLEGDHVRLELLATAHAARRLDVAVDEGRGRLTTRPRRARAAAAAGR